jgi:hypothetical protein
VFGKVFANSQEKVMSHGLAQSKESVFHISLLYVGFGKMPAEHCEKIIKREPQIICQPGCW